MQPQTRSSWDDLPLKQKIEFMQYMAFFPALTVMLFMRRDLGYRMLNPLWLTSISFVMCLVAGLAGHTPYADALLIFAGIVFVGGLAERLKRGRQINKGLRLHTYYPGDSFLHRLPMPRFMRNKRRLERFIDPLVCIVAGGLLCYFSKALGGWMVFSGMCMRVFDDAIYKAKIERELDLMDGMIEAEAQEEIIEHYSVRIQNDSGRPVNGIPTGCSADIQKTILRRSKRTPRE